MDNADKVFFPDAGLTKADLADYYRRIAPTMLPLASDRPVTLNRLPDGIDGVALQSSHGFDRYSTGLKFVG